jgi:hypothetical protein
MYDLPLDLDQNPEWVPPFGNWRVLDLERWDSRKATVVGDFPSLGAAMDQLHLVRYPKSRTVINDMGVVVATVSPSSKGTPNSGAES